MMKLLLGKKWIRNVSSILNVLDSKSRSPLHYSIMHMKYEITEFFILDKDAE
ncbi:MAG: hypothetical protein AB8U20_06790 [Rickettsiales endosymbiont of Dermacentor nuttalli]